MNQWIESSIDYANRGNYLDDLFEVYPTNPEGIRTVDDALWREVETAFRQKDNGRLLGNLLKLELFPIKDSYVAYLRRDASALARNPATVTRLCGRLYDMGLEEIFDRCSEPKETNRQIGPLFRRWLKTNSLGMRQVEMREFIGTTENAILDASDAEMMEFAATELGYSHHKGLDFVARFLRKYVIGEAKFLTDFGGHQNAQFNDAIATIRSGVGNAIPIAILDGVLYIEGDNKMYRDLTTTLRDENIMSSLVLRDFLERL